MNREEFKYHACRSYGNMVESIMNDTEPFWIPEIRAGWKASEFLEIKSIGIGGKHHEDVSKFWEWCSENLSKNPLCFVSDSCWKKEWWGFNSEEDAVMFKLRFG